MFSFVSIIKTNDAEVSSNRFRSYILLLNNFDSCFYTNEHFFSGGHPREKNNDSLEEEKIEALYE